VVRRGAGLDADKTTGQLLEERQHLTAPQLPADDNVTSAINAVDLENILRDIQTNRDNFVHRTAPISLWFMKTTILAPRCLRVGAVHRIRTGRSVDPRWMSAPSQTRTSGGASEVQNRVYGKPPLNPNLSLLWSVEAMFRPC